MSSMSAEAEFALWARECGWDPAWDEGCDPAESSPPDGLDGDEVFELGVAFDPAPVIAQARLDLIRATSSRRSPRSCRRLLGRWARTNCWPCWSRCRSR